MKTSETPSLTRGRGFSLNDMFLSRSHPALPETFESVLRMSNQQTLHKARHHVQSGRYDAAIQLCRGLLRLTPMHPQINGLLGAVLIQTGRPEQAVQPLEVAFSVQPENPENWVKLLIAHHRGGDIHRARELLELGAEMGVPQDKLAVFAIDLSEPPENMLRVIEKLTTAGNNVSAEIAARMLVTDYPESQTAKACLQRVLEINHEQ